MSRWTPSLTICVSSASSNTGLRSNRFQPSARFCVVADFLGVEIRALFLNLLQVELHVDQHLLRDHRRQEAVERLLGAAVGIVDQVGQGIDHRPGQRRRVADFEPRLIDPPLAGHVHLILPTVSSGRSAPAKLSVLSMPWT